jgi:hypothetical protein
MKKLLPLIFLVFVSSAFAQSDLPDIGSLADIKGKTKLYIIADAESRKPIIKRIDKQKGLAIVNKPDEAEFFLEYKTLSRERITSLEIPFDTGQLDAFCYHDKKKVIAWSQSKIGGYPPDALIKRFLKEFTAK